MLALRIQLLRTVNVQELSRKTSLHQISIVWCIATQQQWLIAQIAAARLDADTVTPTLLTGQASVGVQ